MKEKQEFLNTVKKYMLENGMLKRHSLITVGLSGGADSVALLRVLCLLREEYELKLSAVHVHHKIRGESADGDLEYARSLCRAWEVDFYAYRIDVPAAAAREHLTLEEAGRKVRYEAFEEVCTKTKSTVIAVAHHMDDLAETVLMNIMRGSGIRGLAGISPVRRQKELEIIRPLLCVRKRDIEQWLTEQDIAWRTDETNAETDYCRNRIRNILIPELEAHYNSRITEHLLAAAAQMREADDYISMQAEGLAREWKIAEDKGCIVYPVQKLCSCPHILQSYLIRYGLSELGIGLKDITRSHIEAVIGLLDKNGSRRISLPYGCQAAAEYDRLYIRRVQPETEQSTAAVSFDIFPYNKDKNFPQNCCANWFDYDKIKSGMVLRHRRPQDRICVNAQGNYKKLSDVLVNAKIPAAKRDKLYLLASGNDILWIPGYRMAENLKVTENTRLILQVSLNEKL